MRRMIFAIFAAAVCCGMFAEATVNGVSSSFDAPSVQSLKALKATSGRPFSSGYVFVDGRYISPPYKVQRYGTVIRINGVQVTGEIVPWNEFIKTQEGVKSSTSETPAPAAPAAPEPVAEQSEEAAEEPEEIGGNDLSLDDLFADEPAPKKKKDVKKRTVSRPKPKPKKVVPAVVYTFDGEFKHNAKTQSYLKTINTERTKIELVLRKGGYYFFGSRYPAMSGDAGTALYLIEKLPPAMKANGSCDSFCNLLRSAGLNYMPAPLMEDLYRNRIGYIMLERRIKADKEAREWAKLLGE